MKEAMDALDQVIRQWAKDSQKSETEIVYYGA
jgi:hypothetical protein